jgi:hypothetical protein
MAALQDQPRGPIPHEIHDPQRVITLRLPQSVHEGLKKQAHRRQTSLNSMCVEELRKLVPAPEVSPEIPSYDGPSPPQLPQ